jgi:histidine triad (HIT) family protein
MSTTVFAKILAGELPCHRVYENDDVLAFLDIQPLSFGHTLLIPKEPAPTLDQLSPRAGAALGAALPALCRAVCAASGTTAYNILQNNGKLAHQEVLHVHFHIIPRFAESGLWVGWKRGAPPEASLAAKIVAAMGEGGG